MGVEFLLKTCLDNADSCTETVDLVEVARQKGGLELIVDFYSFLYAMLTKFYDILCRQKENSFIKISGGEYASLNSFLTKFVNDLKHHQIVLVFYMAAAKGSSKNIMNLKWDTWVVRHKQDIIKASQILDVLNEKETIASLGPETFIHPLLIEEVFVQTLKMCGCEVHQSAAGEARTLIIKAFLDRPKAFAIWSDNTYYCVIEHSKLIFTELFDLEKDLVYGELSQTFSWPQKLKVKVVTNEKLLTMLKITDNETFIEVAIIAGNDYTRNFMRDNRRILNLLNVPHQLQYPSLVEYVEWMKSPSNLERYHDVFETEMERELKFRNAVTYSRQMYNVQCMDEDPPGKCNYSPHIEENVKSCQFASEIMSMHHNYYWHRKLIEESDSDDVQLAEWALQELRKYVYRIVLAPAEKCVTEGGRIPNKNVIRHEKVYAVDRTEVPSLDVIQPDDDSNNSATFYKIMSHLETGETPNWFGKYGMNDGFVVFVLRYFLNLSRKHKLPITDNEIVALAAMSLDKHDVSNCQYLAICPPARCVTILNWYQDVYRHAYCMLGGLLYLKDKFPLPWELFSGAVWTAVYSACNNYSTHATTVVKVKQVLLSTVDKKRQIIRDIVDGFVSPAKISDIEEGRFRF